MTPPIMAQGTAADPDPGVSVGVAFPVCVAAGVAVGVIPGVGAGVAVATGGCNAAP